MAIGINSSYREDLSDDFIYFPEECKQKKGSNMAKESLMVRMLKTSTIKHTEVMSKSEIVNNKDIIVTRIPAMNIAFSGTINGGFSSGLTMWAGESKTFKTMFSLLMAAEYLKKYDDAVICLLDSEFGSSINALKSLGVDPARVIHIPIMDIEEMTFELVAQLEAIERGDHVFILVDSVGNLASKREKDNAVDQKSVQDMTRAKALKSAWRMVTPYLTLKNIPMVVINHTYSTQELYSKEVVSGGRGGIYSADSIFIVSKRQEKDGTDLVGFSFVINVEKSRYCREKSKIPITVKFEGGVSKWSGLLDLALESGVVQKPSNGWYSRVDSDGVVEERKWRAKDTDVSEFWEPILKSPEFNSWIETNYKIANAVMLGDESAEEVEE